MGPIPVKRLSKVPSQPDGFFISMRTPCDTASQSTEAEVACREAAKPWILAATILASSMAFIDSTAINIALPSPLWVLQDLRRLVVGKRRDCVAYASERQRSIQPDRAGVVN